MDKQISRIFFAVFVLLAKTGSCEDSSTTTYDYIVVGAGSAGCVVANRLSENPAVTVTVLEAGGLPPSISEIPMLAAAMLRSPVDWNYTTLSQKHCCRMFIDQKISYSRGKTLGGCSSLNFLAWTRGGKFDYKSWKMDGWSYDEVHPYFIKMEDYRAPMRRDDETHHGKHGPVGVEVPEYTSVLAKAYCNAFASMGFEETDYNARYQEGFMQPPSNTKNYCRCGSYEAYLLPAMGRKNLRVETYAMATKILLENSFSLNAIGVQYEKNGVLYEMKANKEVIVCAGAVNSPQLLMLSGIGPQKQLERKKIPIKKDVPGVGKNLQDHVICLLPFLVNQNTAMNISRILSDGNNFKQYTDTKTGPLTTSPNEFICFLNTKRNSSKKTNNPNIEIVGYSINLLGGLQNLNPEVLSVIPSSEKGCFTFVIVLLHPKSKGCIQLISSNPHDNPTIDPNLLAHPEDCKTLLEGMEIAIQAAETESLKRYGAQIPEILSPYCNSTIMGKKEYLKCVMETYTSTSYHPVGTCKMGNDAMAVVDHRLRVHGVQRLRVADASIMPNIVKCHPLAAVIMIGEKASDMIKEDNNLQQ